MEKKQTEQILNSQRRFFEEGNTLDVNERLKALKRLYEHLRKRQADMEEALFEDLKKSAAESYMCEIGLSLSEISWLLKNTKKLSCEKRVKTPLAQYFAKSYTKASPYGAVLIMSPWNYPFLLSLEPLADAVAAGNTVVLKPSVYSPQSSRVLSEIIRDVFPKEWVCVIEGGRAENSALLELKWDLIFFTGSRGVGKTVLEAAAATLTPVVLELGGKSPCLVDETAKLPLAAKRIVWGKFLNCGQTCVAPDYILCSERVRDELVREIKKQITAQFGAEPLKNPDYGKIINKKHFDRILSLMDPEKLVCSAKADPQGLKIEPAIMVDVSWDDAVMREEIFGPVLPVLTYKELSQAAAAINSRPRPLALYIYSENKENIKYITERCSFGGGCVNDCVIHLATSNMPFGGVGESGMGSYHGVKGFETFSHTKSIVDKKTWFDMPLRYQPYKEKNVTLIKKFVK